MVDSKITSFEQLLTTTKPQKVALVHDWLVGGGTELVVLELHKMFPDAPIYTSYCTDEWREKLDGKVVTGYLQKWPLGALRKFLPLLRQRWFKKLDLSGFDLVISSCGNGEAKFALSKPSTHKSDNPKPKHICYCHTPPHFLWRQYEAYMKNPGFRPRWLIRASLKLLLRSLRKKDYAAAQKVDFFIANSSHIQSDIKQYYGREATVIHPPVGTAAADQQNIVRQTPKHRFYVTVGRLVPHKRVDIIVAACRELGLSLKIIGKGPERANLQKLAGPSIEFLGFVEDSEKFQYLSGAEAFLFASFEDFGIAPIEAMAAGTPVIAFGRGGALDYVVPGSTGELYSQQTPEALAKALRSFQPDKYSSREIKQKAEEFSAEGFRDKFLTFLSGIDLRVS